MSTLQKGKLKLFLEGSLYGLLLALFIWITFFLYFQLESLLMYKNLPLEGKIHPTEFSQHISILNLVSVLTPCAGLFKLIADKLKLGSLHPFLDWLLIGVSSLVCFYIFVFLNELFFLIKLQPNILSEGDWLLDFRQSTRFFLWGFKFVDVILFSFLYAQIAKINTPIKS
jgi:hypothetical protein